MELRIVQLHRIGAMIGGCPIQIEWNQTLELRNPQECRKEMSEAIRTDAQYESLVRDLLSKLNRFAARLAYPDVDLARDLVQDCIIKGYQHFRSGQLEIGPTTQAWMLRVIRNDYLMYKRKHRRVTESVDAPNAAEIPVDHSEAFSSAEVRHYLQEAMESLPEDQREVVVLVDIQQLNYEEAAEVLSVPVGTVRSRLSRARLKLAGKLSFLRGEE